MKKKVPKVPFGSTYLSPREKEKAVGKIFSRVVPYYDQMNDIMSLFQHRRWKSWLLEAVSVLPTNAKIIDMGGGTGDIAMALTKRGYGNVTVADINEDMLSRGKHRALQKGMNGIRWKKEDATNIREPNGSYDAYITAFTMRNVSDIQACLQEAHRILKTNGQYYCLEFSQVIPPLESVAKLYLRTIKHTGGFLFGDRESYDYLENSIYSFDTKENYCSRLKKTGFHDVSCEDYHFGIVCLHHGIK